MTLGPLTPAKLLASASQESNLALANRVVILTNPEEAVEVLESDDFTRRPTVLDPRLNSAADFQAVYLEMMAVRATAWDGVEPMGSFPRVLESHLGRVFARALFPAEDHRLLALAAESSAADLGIRGVARRWSRRRSARSLALQQRGSPTMTLRGNMLRSAARSVAALVTSGIHLVDGLGAPWKDKRYLNALFVEVARLMPPAWLVFRSPKSEASYLTEVGNVRPRSIGVSPLLIHRSQDLESAAQFRPERWLHDDQDTPTTYAFGTGAARCLGEGLVRYLFMEFFRRHGSSVARREHSLRRPLLRQNAPLLTAHLNVA